MSELSLGRLLIVDDEVELTAALREMLAEQGYETMGFTSGRDRGWHLIRTWSV